MAGIERTYPQRPFLAASCAVFRHGRVLLAQRARPPLSAVWSLPGGLVEPGERLEAAALRELMEEVGVSAEIVGFAGHSEVIVHEADTIKYHFVIAAFAARWRAGEPRASGEALDVMWAEPQALEKLATTDGLADIVARAAALAAGA
jgi:ADP-ribose pyrophosphatase YjhB (NUDIX family)